MQQVLSNCQWHVPGGWAEVFLSAVFPAGLVPLGPLGSVEFTLATLPLISNQYIELDVNVSVPRPGQRGSWCSPRGGWESWARLGA